LNSDPLDSPGIPTGPWSIVGVELNGAAPLDRVRIPLVGHRISVLYGLNGAGKTTVLTALRAALRGDVHGAPLLRSFRLHLELADPTAEDSVTRKLRARMVRRLRWFGYEPDDDSPLRGLGQALIRARLGLVTGDPCCTPDLRAGLTLPEAGAPLRATLTPTTEGHLRLDLALRPDESSPVLLRELIREHSVSEPGHPVLEGSAGHVVWHALGRTPEEPEDHRCSLHVGQENVELLQDPEEQEFRAHPRAFTTRWADDWLFSGRLDEFASPDDPPPAWVGVPFVPVTTFAPDAILPIVAGEDDDPQAAAERAVERVMSVALAGEPARPSRKAVELRGYGIRNVPPDEGEVADLLSEARDHISQTLDKHDASIRSSLIRDILTGRELAPFSWSSWDVTDSYDIEPAISLGLGRVHMVGQLPPTRLLTALTAVNAAAAAWVRGVVSGIEARCIADRHERFRRGDFWDSLKAGDLEVRTDALSTAQERWIRIALAVLGARDWTAGDANGSASLGRTPHLVLIIDEPEQSLHRDAERAVRSRFEDLVRDENVSTIVATHSPLMLDSDLAVLNHVTITGMRGGLSIRVDSETSGPGAELAEIGKRLGARVSDLVGLQRVFVLVEGETDRIILETLFGDELTRLRATVLPFGGTDGLHAIVTPFKMLALTDASVVVVLDHVDHARMATVWDEARSTSATKGPNRAVVDLTRRSFDRHAERTAVGLAKEAIKQGQLDRFSLVGIDAIDILELLPFEALGCTHTSEDLEEAKRANASQRWTSQRTKDWLKDHGADLSTASIRAAVERMDSVPADLIRVLDAVRAVSERQRTD
jgi:hypothetical protein